MDNIVPVLDLELIQEEANKAATKAIISATNDFYSGYNSPIKKIVSDKLKEQTLGNWNFELPNMIHLMQEAVTKEFNTVVSQVIIDTYIPLVAKVITGGDKEISFYDMLHEFVKSFELEYKDDWDMDDFELEVNSPKETEYKWINVTLHGPDSKSYELTLYLDKETNQRYMLSMPARDNSQVMKIRKDDVEIELPFNKAILADPFNLLCAKMLLNRTKINFNSNEDFDEDMFPERCHCD